MWHPSGQGWNTREMTPMAALQMQWPLQWSLARRGIILRSNSPWGHHHIYPPPLRKHGRGPKNPGKTAVQRPPPCLDKTVLVCGTHDDKHT